MLSFGAPRLIRVKRNHDNRAAPRTASHVGAEPLNAHTLIVARCGQLSGVAGWLDGGRRPGGDGSARSSLGGV
jgi:hypothetical protein